MLEAVLGVDYGPIPGELKSMDRWVVWRYEMDDGIRISKPSYCVHSPLERASSTDPTTWDCFADAYTLWRFGNQGFDGLAIAITEDVGIVGIDLDHISDWSDEAWDIVRMLGSYTEWSPSGDGYRIFCYARLPEGRRKRDYVEMYDNARIFTVTGRSLNVSPHLRYRQDVVEDVHHLFVGTDYARARGRGRVP